MFHAHLIPELPPRTRRILHLLFLLSVFIGTTSAYAENTTTHLQILLIRGNYLRVRGEYRFDCEQLAALWELPPRTRRIHKSKVLLYQVFGTTSAYAENTYPSTWRRRKPWNYLRVRGEYQFLISKQYP